MQWRQFAKHWIVPGSIGSAGLEIVSVLLEGDTEALENDILISMKTARPSAAAQYVNDKKGKTYFKHEGHRIAGQPPRRPEARWYGSKPNPGEMKMCFGFAC